MSRTPVEKRLLRENRSARRLLSVAVATGFLAAGLFVAQAWFLSDVVDRVFLRGQMLATVLPLLLLMVALASLRAGLIWAGDLVAQRASSRFKTDVRVRLVHHIYTLGPAFVGAERSGELVNTVVEGVEALDEFFTQYWPARMLAALVPALVFLVVLWLDPWTTLVYLVAGPFLLLLLALIGGRTKAISERRFTELSWLSAHFLDMLQGLPTLKAFGRSKEQAANIEQISRHYGKTTMEVLRTAFQTSLVMEWSATAATALVALEVSLRLMNGLLSFDRALAVLLLTPEFFLPLRQLALKYHAGTAGKAAATRIYAILDLPRERCHAVSQTLPPAAVPKRFDIRFDHVTYAYADGNRPALRGVSFTLRNGTSTALVGPSGAGKSTVANLLLRFICADAGAITVSHRPLEAIDPVWWRTQVAWVSQHPHLFHGTVAENLRLAKPDATQDEMEAAARAAYAHEFIAALPDGYATPIGERGVRLSGGQRQRIAIARAYLKDAPLLILDEATAHLDDGSERFVLNALDRLLQGRTALIIAHRLQVAYEADTIVVLDQGRAVQQGSHRELMRHEGLYTALVASYEVSRPPALLDGAQ